MRQMIWAVLSALVLVSTANAQSVAIDTPKTPASIAHPPVVEDPGASSQACLVHLARLMDPKR